MHVPEGASHKLEKWDWKDSRAEEIVASASLTMIGRAAFAAAVEQHPGARLTLRHGACDRKGGAGLAQGGAVR
jgi:hypothetical protein